MARFNTGILFTNDNCIGCNKCVSQCSILGANVSVIKGGKPKIVIDGDKCNHCGKCIRLCSHGARDYLDDIKPFFEALETGKKISLIVAPSFYLIYKDNASQILGYLKSLGIQKIYDGAFGAEISLWGHVNYLHDHINDNDAAYITQTCPALINMIELYHPDLLSRIIPVQSPMICTAIYARKYLGDKNEIAFLGPCISKKDEISSLMTEHNVQYSITYKRLFEYLGDIDMSSFSAESDLKTEALGNLIPVAGGFAEAIQLFFSQNERIIAKEGFTPYLFSLLKGCARVPARDERPLAIDILACMNGCQEGPGVDFRHLDYDKLYCDYNKAKRNIDYSFFKSNDPEDRIKQFNKFFKDLKLEDFKRIFEDRYKQQFKVPETTIQEIFSDMLKRSTEEQNINCHSCGYNTCRDMATAIALGYNKKENCIKYMNEQMLKQINTDQMTGFMNRSAFQRKVRETIDANPEKAYIIAVGNINKIKIVNDLYTSKAGDLVICKAAENIITSLNYNGFVARLGGDTFAFCAEYTVENLELVYNIPVLDLSDYGIEIPITMRFGIYIADTSMEDILSVMNLATIAMVDKISSTKNTFSMFTKEMHQNIKREIEITSQMQSAIGNDEFQLFYQPQFDANTERIVGAEVLCRWIKPDGTVISPGVFIPISEKNGFIRALDKAIWDKAFKNVRKWIDDGLKPVPTSVNISRVSLSSDDLIYAIQRIQEKYQIPVELIHFEITESAYMEDQYNLIRRINEIRRLGFKIAMDDFGSGYSSLNTLKDIPIDLLKLDMGFIRENSNMDKGNVIINSIVKMAKSLDLITVAEGVETKPQAEFLKSLGVNVIQGYYYSKPIPQRDYEDRLREIK